MLVMLSMVIIVPPLLVVTPKKDWDRGVIRLCLGGQAWRCRYKLNWEVGRGLPRSSWRDWFQVALSLATRWTNFLWGGWKGKGGGVRERERNHLSDCWVVSAHHIYLILNDAGGALNVHSDDFAYFQFCFCDNKLETLQCIVGIGIGAGFRGHYINFDNNVLFCTLLV